MGFYHFLLFFVIQGCILSPYISSSSFYHLNLTPTSLGINLKTVLISWNSFYSFFLGFVVHGQHITPTGQMPAASGRPIGHPLIKSAFSPLFSIYALGFITRCSAKLNSLLNNTLLSTKAILTDFDHFQPFLPSLPGFRLRSSTVQMSGASKS